MRRWCVLTYLPGALDSPSNAVNVSVRFLKPAEGGLFGSVDAYVPDCRKQNTTPFQRLSLPSLYHLGYILESHTKKYTLIVFLGISVMSTPSSRDDSTLIQVDTVADWERLQANFADAIERALDAQLGPNASGTVRDALKQHLVHVSSFVLSHLG